MPNKGKLSIDVRYKVLQRMQKDYKKGKRKERSQLLDQMERIPWDEQAPGHFEVDLAH